MFGKEILGIKFFKHQKIKFLGKEMIIARSGWSHQLCYEIYVDGYSYGEAIWDKLFKSNLSAFTNARISEENTNSFFE